MRVFLADDQPKVRSALRTLLTEQTDIDIVGEATEALELLSQVGLINPDLLLLDWELPGLTKRALVSGLRGQCPQLVVIALSGWPEAQEESLSAGVDAFVSKGDPPDTLLTTIEMITFLHRL